MLYYHPNSRRLTVAVGDERVRENNSCKVINYKHLTVLRNINNYQEKSNLMFAEVLITL
jgi:hypothetical protein